MFESWLGAGGMNNTHTHKEGGENIITRHVIMACGTSPLVCMCACVCACLLCRLQQCTASCVIHHTMERFSGARGASHFFNRFFRWNKRMQTCDKSYSLIHCTHCTHCTFVSLNGKTYFSAFCFCFFSSCAAATGAAPSSFLLSL